MPPHTLRFESFTYEVRKNNLPLYYHYWSYRKILEQQSQSYFPNAIIQNQKIVENLLINKLAIVDVNAKLVIKIQIELRCLEELLLNISPNLCLWDFWYIGGEEWIWANRCLGFSDINEKLVQLNRCCVETVTECWTTDWWTKNDDQWHLDVVWAVTYL